MILIEPSELNGIGEKHFRGRFVLDRVRSCRMSNDYHELFLNTERQSIDTIIIYYEICSLIDKGYDPHTINDLVKLKLL